jgi:hypothetical protein
MMEWRVSEMAFGRFFFSSIPESFFADFPIAVCAGYDDDYLFVFWKSDGLDGTCLVITKIDEKRFNRSQSNSMLAGNYSLELHTSI